MIILGSSEHSCDRHRARWCPPPPGRCPKQPVPGAGAVGVVPTESAPGPEVAVKWEAVGRCCRTSRAAVPGCPHHHPPWAGGGGSVPWSGTQARRVQLGLPEAERSPLVPFSPRISTNKWLTKRAEAAWFFCHSWAVRIWDFQEWGVPCRRALGWGEGDGAGRLSAALRCSATLSDAQPVAPRGGETAATISGWGSSMHCLALGRQRCNASVWINLLKDELGSQ